MSEQAFFVAGNRVLRVANPSGAGLEYRARSETMAPGTMVPALQHQHAETIILVEAGTLELMAGGATGHLSAGEFARIPPGVIFAYRNPGATAVRLLKRTSPQRAARPTRLASLMVFAAA